MAVKIFQVSKYKFIFNKKDVVVKSPNGEELRMSIKDGLRLYNQILQGRNYLKGESNSAKKITYTDIYEQENEENKVAIKTISKYAKNEKLDYIRGKYESYDEDKRLISQHGKVEYLTTMKYIKKYVPKGSKILEVGAATGRYSIALSRDGYSVSALELLEHHIQIFKSKLTKKDNIRIEQGNALDLSMFEDGSFDAVLLLGPMYHFYCLADKLKALNEAKRVLKDDGYLFVAYCLSDATMFQYAFNSDGSALKRMIAKGLVTDDFRSLSEPSEIFEIVRLDDIKEYNRLANLKRVKIVATDGFTHYDKKKVDGWDSEIFNLWLKYHFSICEREDLMGVSNHVLDIVRK